MGEIEIKAVVFIKTGLISVKKEVTWTGTILSVISKPTGER